MQQTAIFTEFQSPKSDTSLIRARHNAQCNSIPPAIPHSPTVIIVVQCCIFAPNLRINSSTNKWTFFFASLSILVLVHNALTSLVVSGLRLPQQTSHRKSLANCDFELRFPNRKTLSFGGKSVDLLLRWQFQIASDCDSAILVD